MTGVDMGYSKTFSPSDSAPWWARLTGKRHRDSSYRYSWGEWAPKNFGLGLKLYCYDEPGVMVSPIFGSFYINLRQWGWVQKIFAGCEYEDSPQYGFSFEPFGEWACELHFHWGMWTKHVQPPWGWNKRKGDYSREYLSEEGDWCDHKQYPYSWIDEADRKGVEPWSKRLPYHYLLDGGAVQSVMATIGRQKSTRTFRLFGIPVRRKTEHLIDIEFDGEVGERAGSWKGGCTGCSYTMKPDETPDCALLRMQRERRFR